MDPLKVSRVRASREDPHTTTGTPSGEARHLAHSDQQTWIVGHGWVDISSPSANPLDSIPFATNSLGEAVCFACGDEGRIPTGWSDEGTPEAPCPVITDWEYCTCPRGSSLREDEAFGHSNLAERKEPDAIYAAAFGDPDGLQLAGGEECQVCSDSGFIATETGGDEWTFCTCTSGSRARSAYQPSAIPMVQ